MNEQGETRREALTVVRDDFWTSTGNKQLNFVQHAKTILAMHGRAAVVVVPDNVLFEGGAGEIVRRKLLHECDVHTLLRLPTGIFYAQGVKANVLFFDRKAAAEAPWTKQVWIYDLRTNMSVTLKENPLRRGDLDEFVALYNPRNRHERSATWSETTPEGRWRAFGYDEIVARDKASLDIFWLRDESLDDSASLPHPGALAWRSWRTCAPPWRSSPPSRTTWRLARRWSEPGSAALCFNELGDGGHGEIAAVDAT